MRPERAIQRPQERPALALVVLPGVLAVEDHEDGGLSPAGARAVALASLGSRRDEVVGRRVCATQTA